jgi:DNA-binding MarR family transcriptional regulator
MANETRNAAENALTDFIVSLFRANNLTTSWGDRLVAPFGLTSARWQILDAIISADHPQPVAWLARDLGANRQNVQRIVKDLTRDGLVALKPNPHHRRAHLVVLTDKGHLAYDAAVRAYTPKAIALAEGLSIADLKAGHRVMVELRAKLESDEESLGSYEVSEDGV